jgi:Na+/melibiose symporter-like transporter
MLQQDSSVAFAYGISAFALQILHCVFITFFTPLYFCVHRISSTSFYVGQLCYLVWNSINDPLIGNWSDTSAAASSVGRRIPALLYGGPLCAVAFAAIWFPSGCFWGDCKAAPSDAVILFSFVAQTFIYDGFFTYLTLAHASLLADLTASHRIRASFTRWQAIFSAVAALFGVVVAASLWQPSDLRPFRRWALLLAAISAACFVWSARIIGKYEANLRSSAELLTVATENDLKSTVTSRKSLLQYASDWFKLCTEVFQLSSFRWFVLVSSTQQFLCSFNNSMWIIFMDIFFGTWLVPWQRVCNFLFFHLIAQ